MEVIFEGERQETFIKNAVSANRDVPGNRDLLLESELNHFYVPVTTFLANLC